jgi:hypothetical protein
VSKRRLPSYEELTRGERDKSFPEGIPLVFDRNKVADAHGRAVMRPGHQQTQTMPATVPKKKRLRDQLQTAWAGPGDAERALQLAAYAVGGSVEDIPEEARESLASLTAWVFAMRAVGGSVEHFREIGDRIDPKPKRIEIEGVVGARSRGGSGTNPDEVAAANAYYATLGGEVIDADFTQDDLSFLD